MSNQTTLQGGPSIFEIDQRTNLGREVIRALLLEGQGDELTIYVSRSRFEYMFGEVEGGEGEDEDDDEEIADEENGGGENHRRSVENLEKVEIQESTMCSICLDGITPSSETDEEEDKGAAGIPCGHVYHHKCIFKWLLKQQTCPLCRYKITS
ncbi:E3 ubiquitin-protein ligase CIP8-like [Neltuma alba]|uniref:E3 ubiquitin-protein ligase CIP8-like n=1 Tax=Neltuma alba TaxID=207710 RepID=UPI0010A3995D|nr:E3 ubiquitin-protein ligase CIP8-like [Prosopis alba]